jgi:hypothetical protein
MNYWTLVRDGNKKAFELFSRHYTFRKWRVRTGKNGGRFAGPGQTMILLSKDERALFIWRKELWRRDGQTGICCSVFRNESDTMLSSELIKEAVSLAKQRWPGERLFTFVNGRKIKSSNPGFCFIMAGWARCGVTKERKLKIIEYFH